VVRSVLLFTNDGADCWRREGEREVHLIALQVPGSAVDSSRGLGLPRSTLLVVPTGRALPSYQ